MSDDEPDDDDEDDDEADATAADLEATDPRLVAAWAAYRAGEPGEGEPHARAFIAERPEHGSGWYALACLLERRDQFGAADRCFRSASRAKESPRATPYRCSWRRFRQIVESARDALRPELRLAFDEVELVLADYADPSLLEGFADAELLGLFIGPERGDREASEFPPRIILFRRAHEHACREADEFANELKRTLWHEFGHYLGYGEEGIGKLGLE